MAKGAGRLALLKKAGTAIAGVKVSTMDCEGTPIDVSDQNSSGMVQLLAGVFTGRQMTLGVTGVEADEVLRNIAADPSQQLYLTDLTFVFGNALAAKDTITGDFFMTKYGESAADDGAVTFSATFVSSGSWTLT